MSLFVCDNCACVDNTALTRYWLRNFEQVGNELRRRRDGHERALCSECDPSIAKWHGRFPKEPYDGKREVLNRVVGHGRDEHHKDDSDKAKGG